MQRALIRRVKNGATLEVGTYVTRRSGMSLYDTEQRTVEYDAPRVFQPGAEPGAWELPVPIETVRSVHGNRDAGGGFCVATLSNGKYGGGDDYLIPWDDLPKIAQAIANTPYAGEAD